MHASLLPGRGGVMPEAGKHQRLADHRRGHFARREVDVLRLPRPAALVQAATTASAACKPAEWSMTWRISIGGPSA